MEYAIRFDELTTGMVVRFDYTCADGSARNRFGMVHMVTTGGLVLLLNSHTEQYRTHVKERISNLRAVAPCPFPVPAGWDHI